MTRVRVLCLAVVALLAVHASAEPEPRLGAPESPSLSVYSDGVALVREQRSAVLRPGRNRLQVASLPARIDPTSIRVASDGVSLVEVGEPAAAASEQGGYGGHGVPVVRPAGRELTMDWVLEANRAMEAPVTVTYLTDAVTYAASLDVALGPGDEARVDGWITLRNDSGIAYRDAQVALVTAPARKLPAGGRPTPASLRREIALPSRVTLPTAERHRVRVLSREISLGPERIVVEGGRLVDHERELDPTVLLGRREIRGLPALAERRRRMTDDDRAAIAAALPPAKRRIYEGRDAGSLLVEEAIDPASMSADLSLGPARGVRVRRRQLGYERDRETGHVLETIEIRVENQRDREVEVEILEHLYRSPSFEIEGASGDLEVRRRAGGSIAEARLVVPARSPAKLTFTVLYRP